MGSTVIADETLDISHDLGISLVGIRRHRDEILALFRDGGRVQDKRDRQEAFDPFDLVCQHAPADWDGLSYQLVSTVRLAVVR